jgi:hypothetical protein
LLRPEALIERHPVGGGLEARWLKPARDSAANLLASDQICVFQQRQMLRERRESHRKRRCQITHRHLALGQPSQYGAARWVGQSKKCGIQRLGVILYHTVKYIGLSLRVKSGCHLRRQHESADAPAIPPPLLLIASGRFRVSNLGLSLPAVCRKHPFPAITSLVPAWVVQEHATPLTAISFTLPQNSRSCSQLQHRLRPH